MPEIEIHVPGDGDLDQLSVVEEVFGEFHTREDWAVLEATIEPDRCLVARDGSDVVGGTAAYSFELTVPGDTVPAAGVTLVGVRPTHRRRGILRRFMERQIRDVHDRGEPVAALWSSQSGIYSRFGYGIATEHSTFEIEREHTGFVDPVSDAGTLHRVEGDEAKRAITGVYERVRPTQPGFITRSPALLEMLLHPWEKEKDKPLQCVAHAGPDGRTDGYVVYRFSGDWDEATWMPNGRTQVRELLGTEPHVAAALWRFVFDIDLTRTTEGGLRPATDPLLHLLADPRSLRRRVLDGLWVRLVDVDTALEARGYPVTDTLTFGVRDEIAPWNEDAITLEASPEGASCRRAGREPELVLDVSHLGAAYLGGARLATYHGAGLVEERTPGAVARADLLLSSPIPPWCPYLF